MIDVVCAILFAALVSSIRNKFVDIREALEQSAQESGLIPASILEALKKRSLVEVTTRQRTVYVGWVLRGPGIASNGSMVDVAVTPLSSGYRDPVDRSVVLTMDYEPVLNQKIDVDENATRDQIDELLDRIGLEMSILLPIDEIVSMRPFTIETKVQFEEANMAVQRSP